MSPITTLFITVATSLAFHSFVSAALVNVTVDDAQTINGVSTIQYTPANVWNVGNGCKICVALPDPAQALDATWHDSTYNLGTSSDLISVATMEFDGTAIYVYCIIAHTFGDPDGNTDMTFLIDGSVAGRLLLAPTNQTTYSYNFLVHSSTNLSPGSHVFTLQNGRVGQPTSLVLLDYIIYTHDDGTTETSSQSASSSSSSFSLPSSPAAPPVTQPTKQIEAPNSSQTPLTPTILSSSLPSQTGVSSSSLPLQATARSSSSASEAISSSPETIVSTNSQGVVTVVETVAPSASPHVQSSSVNSGSSRSLSGNTRTTVLASAIPGGIVLIIAICALVYWCRRRQSRYDYSSPPERDIADDPGSSGWAEDAWKANGTTPPSTHGHSSNGHGEFNALASGFSGERTRSVGRGAADTIGRARGLTTSSIVTSASTMSEYSHSSARDHPSIVPNSDDELSYATGPSTRARHPYAARTPDPDDMERYAYGLATVPEMPTPAPSSSASHSHETPHSALTTEPGPSTSRARPSPIQPFMGNQADAARPRRFLRTPSASTEAPPSYEDISRHDSLRSSIHDVKL